MNLAYHLFKEDYIKKFGLISDLYIRMQWTKQPEKTIDHYYEKAKEQENATN